MSSMTASGTRALLKLLAPRMTLAQYMMIEKAFQRRAAVRYDVGRNMVTIPVTTRTSAIEKDLESVGFCMSVRTRRWKMGTHYFWILPLP